MSPIRLHANENPWNPLRELQDMLGTFEGSPHVNEYPDPDALQLRRKLSEISGFPYQRIICTNGSDELIKMITEAFAHKGDTIVTHGPTFVEYGVMARIRGCLTAEVPPLPDLRPDVDQILKTAAEKKAAITFLCSPNNPTGYQFTEQELEALLRQLPGIVVVDEAYIEFAGPSPLRPDTLPDNVVVMRTLSKAYGLAGLRIGYGLASRPIIDQLNRVKMPYNVNALSQWVAVQCLSRLEDWFSRIQDIQQERERLFTAYQNLDDLFVYPTAGNFLLLKSSRAEDLEQRLLKDNIRVRTFTHSPYLKDHLRVSIGLPADNDRVLNSIQEEMKS